jgi:hypothetical protein
MFFRLFFVALILVATQAYPTYTGSCKVGTSVGGSHLKSGSKGAVPLTLTIGGKVVKPGTTFSFAKGKSLAIKLSGSKSFKGFQMRLASGTANTVGYLKKGTSSNVQVDAQCSAIKIGGICHNSKAAKTAVQGSILVPAAKNGLMLQVTVVMNNDGGVSEWYTSTYTLNAV